jgi:hypothetical protein
MVYLTRQPDGKYSFLLADINSAISVFDLHFLTSLLFISVIRSYIVAHKRRVFCRSVLDFKIRIMPGIFTFFVIFLLKNIIYLEKAKILRAFFKKIAKNFHFALEIFYYCDTMYV